MTHTAYTHMKSYRGQTGAADPVWLFSIVCGDEYFFVGTYFRLFLQSSDFAIISCERPRSPCTNALQAVTNALILALKPYMIPDTQMYSQPRATVYTCNMHMYTLDIAC